MRIDSNEKVYLKAEEVESGDTFLLDDGLYIMTDYEVYEVYDEPTRIVECLHAVNLKTGHLTEIDPTEEVQYTDAKVVIE